MGSAAEIALRNEIEAMERRAQPMRNELLKAEKDLKPLEARIQKLRAALDLVIESSVSLSDSGR